MKVLRDFLDKYHHQFDKGGKFARFYPVYEMADTFLYNTDTVTKGKTHVRDALDLKRLMITVFIACVPAMLMAMFNTGFQINKVLASMDLSQVVGWREQLLMSLGVPLGKISNPEVSIFSSTLLGALYFLPVYLVTVVVGGFWEAVFSTVRGHEINEGFLVTSILFPLTLPATIPLWQVAVGISFGVVLGKEVFGGVGKNFLNPALTARAFLFFAYPAQISGDAVWVAVDGFSGATALGQAALGGASAITYGWWESFLGLIPGSMGETSTLAILLGAVVLIMTGIGSWRIMLSVLLGAVGMSLVFNMIGSQTNPMFGLSPAWHLVLGGFAFGAVFMATDPVSASMTFKGQWFYGLLIGIVVILVRVVNPAYPEGMMLAILLANVFAPLIDWFVIEGNVKKRELRNARG